MRKTQGLLIILVLVALGFGNVFMRSDQLTQGQVATNIGLIALIVILLLELWRKPNGG